MNGKYYEIVGRVCMDQMMVRVDENVKIGDRVEIFGEHISLESMAKDLDTISYEVLCLISKRVPRVYAVSYTHLDVYKRQGKYMLMSSHNFDRTPEVDSLMQKFRSMDSLEADIMKVAVMPEDYQDLLNLLSFTFIAWVP